MPRWLRKVKASSQYQAVQGLADAMGSPYSAARLRPGPGFVHLTTIASSRAIAAIAQVDQSAETGT